MEQMRLKDLFCLKATPIAKASRLGFMQKQWRNSSCRFRTVSFETALKQEVQMLPEDVELALGIHFLQRATSLSVLLLRMNPWNIGLPPREVALSSPLLLLTEQVPEPDGQGKIERVVHRWRLAERGLIVIDVPPHFLQRHQVAEPQVDQVKGLVRHPDTQVKVPAGIGDLRVLQIRLEVFFKRGVGG
jgi:hypothetical protein